MSGEQTQVTKRDQPLSKEEWRQLFRAAIVTFSFTKVNGEERIMRGTLSPQFLPVLPDGTVPSTEKQNENILAVWDIANNDWRAFKIDSVKDIFSIEVIM